MVLERLFDSLFIQYEKFPQLTCLAAKANGAWVSYSTGQVIQIVNDQSKGL